MVRRPAFLCRQDGTTAVEFASIVAPLLVLLFGVAEYGQIFWAQEGLQEAAIAGARCVGILSVNCTSSGAYSASATTTFIQAEAQKWSITLPTTGITVNTSTTCGGVAGFSQVSLTYTYQPVMPMLLNLLPTGTTLTAVSCFPTA